MNRRGVALRNAAEFLIAHGLRRDIGDGDGVTVAEAICRGYRATGAHDTEECRLTMHKVARTMGCSDLHEARLLAPDKTVNQWATHLRRVAAGSLS